MVLDFSNVLKAFIGSNFLGMPYAFSKSGIYVKQKILLPPPFAFAFAFTYHLGSHTNREASLESSSLPGSQITVARWTTSLHLVSNLSMLSACCDGHFADVLFGLFFLSLLSLLSLSLFTLHTMCTQLLVYCKNSLPNPNEMKTYGDVGVRLMGKWGKLLINIFLVSCNIKQRSKWWLWWCKGNRLTNLSGPPLVIFRYLHKLAFVWDTLSSSAKTLIHLCPRR